MLLSWGTGSAGAGWSVAVHAEVAGTVGKGIIETGLATEKTVLAALIGAIVWNLFTWWLGLPSSSTHALIGGLAGRMARRPVLWHVRDLVPDGKQLRLFRAVAGTAAGWGKLQRKGTSVVLEGGPG